jgi:hypothetical protein
LLCTGANRGRLLQKGNRPCLIVGSALLSQVPVPGSDAVARPQGQDAR